MFRPKVAQLVMEGTKRFVTVHFTDRPKPEHFMDIDVRVNGDGVMLACKRYDGQIFFPIEALPVIVDAINDQRPKKE